MFTDMIKVKKARQPTAAGETGVMSEGAALSVEAQHFTTGEALNVVASKGAWTCIADQVGPLEVKDRLKSIWTVFGVVSGLMAALTYPECSSPNVGLRAARDNSTVDEHSSQLGDAYVIIINMSLFMSLATVVASAILLEQIEYMTRVEDLQEFYEKFHAIFDTLTGIFSISILLNLGSLCIKGFINYETRIAWGVVAIHCGTIALALPFITRIAIYTRAKLGKLYLARNATRPPPSHPSSARNVVWPVPPIADSNGKEEI